MKATVLSLICLFGLLLPGESFGSEETIMKDTSALNQAQQAFIPIAAFTASGELDRLKPALIQGLEAGLTVNEIKESLVQLYAYTGFPRSLNAIHAFMALLDERKAQGIEDVVGKEASPIPADLDKDAYGAQVRANLSGAGGQLRYHFGGALNSGLTEPQAHAFIAVLKSQVGEE
nr:carboxymuconolactone decarboxylase family protein [uncultured Desulfobulbus sp.]